MTFFFITCTTCNRRLKVTDASAIGQILACPGCSGMVQIRPPDDWNPQNNAKSDQPTSPAVRRASLPRATPLADNFDDAAALLEETAQTPSAKAPSASPRQTTRQPAARPAHPSASAEDLADTVEDLTLSDPHAQGSPITEKAAPTSAPSVLANKTQSKSMEEPSVFRNSPANRRAPEATSPSTFSGHQEKSGELTAAIPQAPRLARSAQSASSADASLDENPVMPSADWASDSTVRLRQWAIIGIGTVLGLCVAAGLLVSMARFFRGSGDPTRGTVFHHSSRNTDSQYSNSQNHNSIDVDPSTDAAKQEAATSENTLDRGAKDPKTDSVSTSHQASESATSNKTPIKEDPDIHGTKDVSASTGRAVSSDAAPDGFSPKPSADPPSAPSGADRAPQLPDDIGRFAPLLETESFSPDVVDAPPSASTERSSADPESPHPDAADPESDGSAIRRVGPRPASRKVDVAARLGDSFRGIEFVDTPLVEYLRFLSDISGVPVTVDPLALAAHDVSPNHSVNVKLLDVEVEKMFKEVLTPLGLSISPHEDRIRIVSASGSKPLVEEHPVDDLVGGSVTPMSLVSLIQEFIAPQSWEKNGGEGAIAAETGVVIVRQSRAVQHQVLVFLEELRVARGRKPRRLEADRVNLATKRRQAEASLSRKLTLNFVAPTRFLTIIRQIEKTAKVRLLIDWDSLAIEHWNPDAEATLTASDLSLEETLIKLLRPMDLAFCIIDADTFQVITSKRKSELRQTEFYQLSEMGIAGDDFAKTKEKLTSELGENAVIRLDAENSFLIARLTAPQHATLVRRLGER